MDMKSRTFPIRAQQTHSSHVDNTRQREDSTYSHVLSRLLSGPICEIPQRFFRLERLQIHATPLNTKSTFRSGIYGTSADAGSQTTIVAAECRCH